MESPYQEAIFRPGTNHLAVEVHRFHPSSDSMSLGLQAWIHPISPSPLAILEQPGDVTVRELRKAALSIVTSGEGARYQWHRNGIPIPNATQRILTFPITALSDGGDYFVTVSNIFDFLTSETVTFSVIPHINQLVVLEADGMLPPMEEGILVTFSEPLDEASATNIAHYTLTSTTGEPVEILTAAMATPVSVRLTTTPRASDANYLLTTTGITDGSVAANTVLPGELQPLHRILPMLVRWDADWRFYDPLDGLDPPLEGHAWIEPEFPDGDWGLGQAGFIPDLSNKHWPVPIGTSLTAGIITSYFRTWFDFPGSLLGAELRARHVVDDGAAFYLNGNEIMRTNVPNGELTADTLALVGGYLLESDLVSIYSWCHVPGRRLRYGSNLLAAELHAYQRLDLDRFLALELDARVRSLPVGPVIVLKSPTDVVATETENTTFTFDAVGASGCQWFLNSEPIPGATEFELILEEIPLAFDGARISVVASNAAFATASEAAILTVLPDEDAPELASAHAIYRESSLTLLFDEPVEPASATNVSHYLLTDHAGNAWPIRGVIRSGTHEVTLDVDPLPMRMWYLTVRGVRDTSAARHVIQAGSRIQVGAQGIVSFWISLWRWNNSGTDQGTYWIDPMSTVYDWGYWHGLFGYPPHRHCRHLSPSARPFPCRPKPQPIISEPVSCCLR